MKKTIMCPIDGSRGFLTYLSESDPFKVYMCRKCRNIYHPPECRCHRCPRPRLVPIG